MTPAESLRQKLVRLPQRLREAIIGQDPAVAVVAERLQHGELGLTTPGRPKASFLFLGPTGVGKTELTLRFSEEIFGPNKVVRLDMSEYQTQERLALLLGSGRDEPGRIAEGFDACGGSGTLLFDEIEKAHGRVLDVLLQILEPARLTTGSNRVLDFSSWYVVLTSNIGSGRIMAMRKSKYETLERLVRQDAQRELRPEIFGRITAAVVFNRLDYETQCRVADVLIGKELQHHETRGFGLERSAGLLDAVIKHGYHERLGARPMRDATERLVRNALAADLLTGGKGCGQLAASRDGLSLRLEVTRDAALK